MSMFVITDTLPQGRRQAASAAATDIAPARVREYGVSKTILDFALALILLILTAPLMALAMVLVKLTSRGPAIYSQTRLGQHARPFTIYKIRTMTNNCEGITGAQWSRPGDSRVTGLGRWLRKTHIDELPQLWNVLRGDMSLIGPRPERPEFLPQLEQAIPHYRQRLTTRPGVTGLAQVQLPPDTDLESVRMKLAYDLYYVKHVSLRLDARIYAATFGKVLGLSYLTIEALCAFPHRDVVHGAYQALSAKPQAITSHATTLDIATSTPRETRVGA